MEGKRGGEAGTVADQSGWQQAGGRSKRHESVEAKSEKAESLIRSQVDSQKNVKVDNQLPAEIERLCGLPEMTGWTKGGGNSRRVPLTPSISLT